MSLHKQGKAMLRLVLLAIVLLVAGWSGQPVVDSVSGQPTVSEWRALSRTVTQIERPETVAVPSTSNGPLAGWPVVGRISQGFGCSPYYTGFSGLGCPAETPWFHDGVDIAAITGTPVRAAITGTVIFAGADGSGPACGRYRGYGLGVVVANQAGWQTLYAHLARIEVAVGQLVTPETIIGAVGETGCVTGAHLHFGLRYGETLVDPRQYVGNESSRRQYLD